MLAFSSSFAYFQKSYNQDLVTKDFDKGDIDKYKADKLSYFSKKALVDKGIFRADQTLIRDWSYNNYQLQTIKSSGVCEDLKAAYTGTIYNIDLSGGNTGGRYSDPSMDPTNPNYGGAGGSLPPIGGSTGGGNTGSDDWSSGPFVSDQCYSYYLLDILHVRVCSVSLCL